jgi:mannose/fructose-specific phosphotransferase system component IIA
MTNKKVDTSYSSGSGMPQYGGANLQMMIELMKKRKEREKKLAEYKAKKGKK